MDNNNFLERAITELKGSSQLYMKFTDFSFFEGIEPNSDESNKLRYILLKSKVFEAHSAHAIRFTELGLDIVSNHKNYTSYKKSLASRRDYTKWAGIAIATISLVWNIFQGLANNTLKEEVRNLKEQNDKLRNPSATTTELKSK